MFLKRDQKETEATEPLIERRADNFTRASLAAAAEEARPQKAKNFSGTFFRLFKYSLAYKPSLLIGNLCLLISSLGMVVLPLLCGQIIDHITTDEYVVQDALRFVVLTVVMALSSAIRGYLFNLLGEKVVRDIRGEMFKKLVQKDVEYYDKIKTGELISRLTSDTTVIESAASDNISILLRNLIQFVCSLVFLFVLSWKLTLFIIFATPVISFIALFLIKKMKKLKKDYQTELAFANALANEVFSNIRVVRSFATEINETGNYGSLLQKTYLTGRKAAFMYGLMLLAMTLFANGLILAILLFGNMLARDGEISVGQLTSFVLYTITLTVGFASVSGIINQLVSAMGVCEVLFEIMDTPVKIEGGQMNVDFSGIKEKEPIIEFQSAGFSYPSKPEVLVLNDLTLKVFRGQSVAFVGSSGSGKTSILNLLLRFYDLTSGDLLLCGTPIKKINLENLRKKVGFVSQEPTLFSGSIRENVEYGVIATERSEARIKAALQVANAAEFVFNPAVLPQGLDTLVGERGVKLSGGQKQRIAIARSVIKNPQILIFDEATSALDAESQASVQTAIDNLLKNSNKTVLIVAHRLSTIINCDLIVVLKDGKVIESGKHTDLLRLKGSYFSLVQKQLAGYQTDSNSQSDNREET